VIGSLDSAILKTLKTISVMDEVKMCRDCEEILLIDYFHYSDKKRGIRKSYCKECCYQRAKKSIAKDPIAYKSYMIKYYKEHPECFAGNHKTKKIPPKSGVYLIDCLLTDDSYIGCSKNLRNRKYRHSRNVGNSKNKPLSKLIKQLGWEAFDFVVLEECDAKDIFVRETHWIQELQPNLNRNKNNK